MPGVNTLQVPSVGLLAHIAERWRRQPLLITSLLICMVLATSATAMAAPHLNTMHFASHTPPQAYPGR